MTFTLHTRTLDADTPGAGTAFNWYEVGPTDAGTKVYLQAALHADEQPGTMVLHHLLPLLREADARDSLRARFIVAPMVNPLGMDKFSFRRHSGRYDPNTGVNYNRRWPDLAGAIADAVGPRLTESIEDNRRIIHEALRAWIANQEPMSAAQAQRLLALELCHDADYVLDLHCDDEALPHIFICPEFMPDMQDLADWVGSRATLTAEDSGGGSFDEMLPLAYRRLAAAFPDKPIETIKVSATLEYRGQNDTFDALGVEDAYRLFGFFLGRGLIEADAIPAPAPMPAAVPFAATQILRAPGPGLLAYRVNLGDHVEKGQPVADLIALDGPQAFIARTPILAGTNGFILSRALTKYAIRGASVAKIVGTEPLESRGAYLLED